MPCKSVQLPETVIVRDKENQNTEEGSPMKIELSGHHVDVTDAIKEHVNGKFRKVASHFPSLISLDVIIRKEHGAFIAEVNTNYEGVRISAKSNDDVMYPALAKVAKKLDAALRHRKGQLKDNLHRKIIPTSPEIAHETIQGMELR